jgi:hypothetical protein
VEAPGIDGAGCCSRDPAVAVELVEISLMLLLTEHFFIAVLFLGKCCWFRLFHKSENFPQDLKTKHSLWISYVVLNYSSKSTKNNKQQPLLFELIKQRDCGLPPACSQCMINGRSDYMIVGC